MTKCPPYRRCVLAEIWMYSQILIYKIYTVQLPWVPVAFLSQHASEWEKTCDTSTVLYMLHVYAKYSQSSLSGHSCKRTALLTAALTKPRLNSSWYKLCIYTFSQVAGSSFGHFLLLPESVHLIREALSCDSYKCMWFTNNKMITNGGRSPVLRFILYLVT